MSSAIAPVPIQIHIPQSLAHLTVPLSIYLQENPSFTNLAVGACVFTRTADDQSSPCQPRLLLVQRAATERGFPNFWEVPGGSAEGGDPTILHSVARGVFEETGLRLTRFVRAVGNGIQITTGRHSTWMKLTFEIEVQEGFCDAVERIAGGDGLVHLDPAEHQAFKWVTEDELKNWGPGKIITDEQRQMMLQAFESHRKLS